MVFSKARFIENHNKLIADFTVMYYFVSGQVAFSNRLLWFVQIINRIGRVSPPLLKIV